MYILKLLGGNTLLFSILIGILIINFGCIIFLVLKEKKSDQEEIDELMNDLTLAKPRRKEPEEKIEIKEIDKLEEEKVDKEVEANKLEIEEMLKKMQKDLETKPEDVVTNFENEQEEKSIISYQELVNSVKSKNENTQVNVHVTKIEEDLENTLDLKEQIKEEKIKKFKNTDFISPIFGKQEDKLKYPTVPKSEDNLETRTNNILDELDFSNSDNNISIEKTIDIGPLKNEMSKNDEFLKALKEFRRNLD